LLIDPAATRLGIRPALNGKRLVLYLPRLAGGGAERLYLNLAPLFVQAGMRVSFLLDLASGELADSVPPSVNVEVIHAPRLRHAFTSLIAVFRRNPPDILLSSISMNSVAVLAAKALAGGSARTIVMQHNTLSRETALGGMFRALPLMMRMLLRRADAIAAVSTGVAADLARCSGVPLSSIGVIPNGVITENFEERLSAECNHPWLRHKTGPVFLGVGRLTTQKDFRTLIKAFAAVRRQRDVRLIILGEGATRPDLLELARSLHVEDSVDLPGYVANPLGYMRSADALVMSSVYEGFGLVLAEALACGTQVVSTDCEHGPADILGGGQFGRLVPVGDWEQMAKGMAAALDAPFPAEMLQARGREFTIAACADHYLRLFEEVLSQPARRTFPRRMHG